MLSLVFSSGTLAFFGVGLWPSLSLGLDVRDSIIFLGLVVVLGVSREFPTLLPHYLEGPFIWFQTTARKGRESHFEYLGLQD